MNRSLQLNYSHVVAALECYLQSLSLINDNENVVEVGKSIDKNEGIFVILQKET